MRGVIQATSYRTVFVERTHNYCSSLGFLVTAKTAKFPSSPWLLICHQPDRENVGRNGRARKRPYFFSFFSHSVLLCSAPPLFVPPWQKYLSFALSSLIRSNIEPKASRPPSVASTAAARGVIRARNVLLPMGHKSSRAGHGKAALATMHGVLEGGPGLGGQND